MVMTGELKKFRGQRIVLLGLGLHGGGVATARWLCSLGVQLRVIDAKSRTELKDSVQQLRSLPIQWRFGLPDPNDIRWADRLVINPAVPLHHPLVKLARRRGIPIDNEASLFVRFFPGRLIGITGTRGKTTTTLLLGAIVKRAHRSTIVSGNVRQVPMLAYISRSTASTWAVLELSSFQLELLPVPRRSFDVAVFTNLKRDHLNRYTTMTAYAAAKARLFAQQQPEQYSIIRSGDAYGARLAKRVAGQVRWFGEKLQRGQYGCTIERGWVVERSLAGKHRILPLRRWSLVGAHNQDNLLAAVTAARALGISIKSIAAAAQAFHGVPHRQEVIRRWRGRTFVNDTAATSPDATLAAVENFSSAVFIVGGTDKNLDYRELAKQLVRRRIPTVVLPGSGTDQLVALMRRYGYPLPFVRAYSMPSAVRMAASISRPGQAIVLSPGAASFGLFRHEFDRGESFVNVVQRLS